MADRYVRTKRTLAQKLNEIYVCSVSNQGLTPLLVTENTTEWTDGVVHERRNTLD